MSTDGWKATRITDAQKALVTKNLGFAYSRARRALGRYPRLQGRLDELVQEGVLGSMRAASTFDPERGVKFISYAVHWIDVYIDHAAVEMLNLVHPPSKMVKGEDGKIRRKQAPPMTDVGTPHANIDDPEMVGYSSRDRADLREATSYEMDVDERIDRERLLERARRELPEAVAPRALDCYASRAFAEDDEQPTLKELGGKYGFSRERARQLELKGKRDFEKWAAEIREDVA